MNDKISDNVLECPVCKLLWLERFNNDECPVCGARKEAKAMIVSAHKDGLKEGRLNITSVTRKCIAALDAEMHHPLHLRMHHAGIMRAKIILEELEKEAAAGGDSRDCACVEIQKFVARKFVESVEEELRSSGFSWRNQCAISDILRMEAGMKVKEAAEGGDSKT